MFDRFDVWQFSDNANCWDYVREYLIEKFSIPKADVPKFGILPCDKRAMTKASEEVQSGFVDAKPVDGAVACHYLGKTILHVGIVDGGMVRHTSRQWGTIRSTIKEFEALAPKTVYKIHASIKHI